MIVFLIVFSLYLILFIKSRKEKFPIMQSWLLRPFAQIASFLMNIKGINKILSAQVCENIKVLFGKDKQQEKIKEFYSQKITLLLAVFFVGTLFILILDLKSKENRYLYNGNELRRSDYHSEEQVLNLTASTNQYKEKVEILVSPMHYTKEEISEVFEAVKDEVMNELTEGEETLSNVQSNLHFINQSSKYPVQIQFESNNDEVVGNDGKVHNEELLKEEIVTLTIKLSYHDLKQEYEVPILVVPKEYTKEQLFIRSLLKIINANEKEQRTSEYLKLPDEIENMDVTYEEIKENPAGTILVILIVTIVFLYLSKDKELIKQIHNRKRELQMEYPEFISKFTLLIGAGMPIKAALVRLVYDYKQKLNNVASKKHVYEELLVTVHEMESGMIEEAAYEAFGKRCAEVNYIKFSGLLIQNKKRGGKKLIELLEKEVKEAFEERKNQSRRLGEEAGTKLLIPMMIMLGVVMTLVIIPAFLSYQ